MSAAAPLRVARAPLPAAGAPFTIADAIRAAVPLVFLVEPDLLWADCAVRALLEEHAAGREADGGTGEVTAARWTRTRRWTSYGATYGFGLSGSEEPLERVDVLEEMLRLADHLASAKRGDEPHPLEGALFSVRGMQPDLARPAAAEVLLEVLLQLQGCRGTLLLEIDREPATFASPAVVSLAPVLRLPRDPRLRYDGAIAEFRQATSTSGLPEGDPDEVLGALEGLSRLQAELVARITRDESERITGAAVDLLELIATARERVTAVLAGAAE
jgi:hypothetical protein